MVTCRHRPHEEWIARRDEVEQRAPHRLDDIGVEAGVPALEVAIYEDDFGGGMGRNEVGGEGDGGRVG